jgi:hypothetical protein
VSDIYPDVRQWAFPKSGPDSRLYEQRELTIDGEMQLLAVISRATALLRENGFPFDRLTEVFPPEGGSVADIRWDTAAELLGIIASVAPGVVTEVAAVLLGIFPVDEYGKRNPSFQEDVVTLRRHIRLADVVDLLTVAAEQNDIERLLAPFVRARAMLASYGPTTQTPPAPTPEV